MMTLIIAQLIGFVGYIFYIRAPQQKTAPSIIIVEAIACTLSCIQWLLLGQISLMILNALTVVVSIISLSIREKHHMRYIIPMLYLGGSMTIFTFCHDTLIDSLAIITFIFMVSSKCSKNISNLRIFAVLSGLCLSVSSALSFALPAFIFNLIFTWGHYHHIIKSKEAPTQTPQTYPIKV